MGLLRMQHGGARERRRYKSVHDSCIRGIGTGPSLYAPLWIRCSPAFVTFSGSYGKAPQAPHRPSSPGERPYSSPRGRTLKTSPRRVSRRMVPGRGAGSRPSRGGTTAGVHPMKEIGQTRCFEERFVLSPQYFRRDYGRRC